MNAPISIKSVVEKTKSIPCAPAILPKLLAIMQGDDSDSRDIAKLVMTDPGLASAVLRLANSAYFASSQKCANVSDAILRLGSLTLYRLAATTVAGRWLTFPVHGYGWQPGDLCRHSLCVAVTAELLAERTSGVIPETAYTAGLIHDVGKLSLAFAAMGSLDEIDDLVPRQFANWHLAEKELLGYDSTDVTRALLESWDFPEPLIAVGTFHPRPSACLPEHRALVALIHGAKHLAIELGYGVGADGFYTELEETSLIEQGFDEATFESAMPEIVDRLKRFVGPDGSLRLGK